ncbi:hypothetical protein H6F89_29400 [Cyanobacteria bacterium FACHB-63]|nr:hypothetical protein [Cyanobacteria bacterium FACHB-63]
MPTKLGVEKLVFKPFEDESDLECLCSLQLRGRDIGAYLLRQGNDRFLLRFAFSIPGIHTFMPVDQVESVLNRLEEGLRGLPEGESLRIHFRSFADDSLRQQHLAELVNQTLYPELQFLLFSQQRHVRELTEQHIRQSKQILLFVTYTLEPGKAGTSDRIERAIAWLVEHYEALKGRKPQLEAERYLYVLTEGFKAGFLHWEQQLNTRMGLNAIPLTAEQLWQALWSQFNHSASPQIPQCLILREQIGEKSYLTEEVNDQFYAVTVAIRGERGRRSTPQSDRRWIHVKDKFVGVLTLDAKPGGFTSGEHQLYYLWQAAAQFPDCEFVCEISRADQHATRASLQLLTRQNLTLTERAQAKNNIDVVAQLKAQGGAEAQAKIWEGAAPVWIAVVALVHRNTPEELDEACQKLSNCFSNGELNRETEIAWKIWLQTLPITWRRLLDDRRQLYFTDEAIGLMPLACTRTTDQYGVELLAHTGGMPTYIDFVRQHRSLFIIGQTRTGKSALLTEIIIMAMAHGFNVVGLDYAREDGTTTFTDLVNMFDKNGAWFDVGTAANNLFEMPDLRQLEPEQQEVRKNSYLAFLVRSLEVMILGAHSDKRIGKRIHAILWKTLTTFFATPEIQQRYENAYSQGFGSEAWQDMPTIMDFLNLLERLDLSGLTVIGSIAEALAEIRLQLLAWVESPVGRAIAQPSTIRSDAQLLIYAMRNLTNDDEAAVLALSAQALALRRALECSDSLLVIDESSVLYKYDGISQIIGQICATGGKAGIRTIVISQDPDAVYHSAAGQQILQNLNTRLIGAIQSTAIESCCRIFGYDRSMLLPNTDESFLPDRSRLCSHWLLDIDGRLQQCDYYPSPEVLAAVANNPIEQQARSRVMAQYSNKFEGWAAFAQQYSHAVRSGISLKTIGQPRHPLVLTSPETHSVA